MRLFIGGDIAPTLENEQLFREGNIEELIGTGLLDILNSTDYRIFNLEVPLVSELKPIKKSGPRLAADKKTISGIRKLKPDFMTLANNHILDQDEQGLYSTVKTLKKNDISYAGAGRNLQEARNPFMKEICGVKLGIYCCAEHEFSVAEDDMAGANPFDPLESFDAVRELRKNCDYVVVLYHGGKEQYRYPTPYLQKVFRKFAKSGADLVIAQHTHCIGCYENYMDSLLVYGQGNFLFTAKHNEFWDSGLCIIAEIEKNGKNQYRFVPFIAEENYIRLAKDEEKKYVMDGFYERSKQIIDEKEVERLFKEIVKKEKVYYANMIHGSRRSFFWRLITKFSYKPYKMIYNKQIVELLNCIRCETHRECIIYGIKEDV